MKRLKISLVALLAIMISFGAMSFQVLKSNYQQDTWYYKGGNDEEEVLLATNWERQGLGGIQHPDCDPEEVDLPCTITGPANLGEFQEHLDGLDFETIRDQSTNKRPFE